VSLDDDLRRLEREARDDPRAHVRWRQALVRAGRPRDAGLEIGDVTIWKGHRLKISKHVASNRRVRLVCLTHVLNREGSGKIRYSWCKARELGEVANTGSKRVGVLVEPADPPGERLDPDGGAHGPFAQRRCRACHGDGCAACEHGLMPNARSRAARNEG
jgi:hypothetical protein